MTNYAEKNPQGYQATHITSSRAFGYRKPQFGERRPSPTTSTAAPQAAASSTESDSSEGGVDPDEAAAEERAKIDLQISKAKADNCDLGKRNLAQLEAFTRIRVKDDDSGEERMMSDEEKASKIGEARQIIRDNCTA